MPNAVEREGASTLQLAAAERDGLVGALVIFLWAALLLQAAPGLRCVGWVAWLGVHTEASGAATHWWSARTGCGCARMGATVAVRMG